MKNIIVYIIAGIFILAATTLILTAGSADKTAEKANIEACCSAEETVKTVMTAAEEACCDSDHGHTHTHAAEEACCDSEKESALAAHEECCGNCQS